MSDIFEYAPTLKHLVPKIMEFNSVLGGWSSGPQPQARDFDPSEPQHIDILIDSPWGECDQWVTLYADRAEYLTDWGELYRLTHEDVWAYLSQLPKRLHHFGTIITPDDE